ncbi:MAG TPA: hypothetical protein VFN56_03190, partial [Candidatus Saccharimonadales bacterium]|nr:hypothetical protein [Candidatus Saccharimonadales bacterium]
GYIETTSIAEYKRRIVEAEWKQMPDEERSAEAMVELSSAFEKMTFYVSARAMDTSARLRDIIADYDVRGEVFELYNRHFNNNDDEPYINTVTDTLRFVREVFIPKAAANLARIHNLGLAHRFPNDLNYTAFGSLVDLDSVHGAPLELGDEEITGKDKARDLLITLYGIDYAQNHIHLLSHNRDIKIDLKSEFLKAYFSDLVAAYGSDDDRLTVASEVVFGVQELVDSENDDDFLGSNRHYMRNKIYDIFVDMFQPLDAMGIGMVDTWLDAELPKLYENALKAVKETVPLYALDLMDEFINEKSDNPDFDIAGLCISNPMKLGRIFEWVQATIIESVESAFNKYLDELAASASPEESASSMWTRRVGILHSQQYNWFKKLEGWSSDTVYRVISDLKDEFTEALNVNWQPRLFPEYRAWPIRSTSPNRYFMETMEVPLAEVMNYIEREKPDLTIEQLQKNSDAGIEFNIEITDDGSIGSELISDGVYDGMSSDYEPVMRAFSLGMPKNGSYILVVEEKPNGTKRLRLFFENEHLVNALNNIGNVMQVLRENIYFQQTLFK